MEFTGNIVGYATSVVSRSVCMKRITADEINSGPIISVLSLIRISHGEFHSLCNVL